MISYLVERAIRDIENNYVDSHGFSLVVRHKYKGSTEKWYWIPLSVYTSFSGHTFCEVGYYNSLVFLYSYYRGNFKHIFLKSTHPELLI